MSIVLATALFGAVTGRAHAADPPPGAVLSFEVEEVKITVRKPDAERLFNIDNLRPEYKLELRESFLPRIVEALDTKPF
ncbi:MAG: hypothetical protein RLZZ299_1161 [Pseudomonadota bacterium]|jgi:hypothetical protein